MLNQEIEKIINEQKILKQDVDNFLVEVASLSKITKEEYETFCKQLEEFRSIRFNSLNKVDKLILTDINKQYKDELSIARNIILPSITAMSNELNAVADILLIWEFSIFK